MLFFNDKKFLNLIAKWLLYIEWLVHHQKVVQFCNQTSIFCSGN